MPPSAKYGHAHVDEDVKRWHGNLAAGSEVTAEVYLRTLALYRELEKTTPRSIIEHAASKKSRDGFTDFVRRLESQKKAGSYIQRFKKVIAS